jgi:hypothetical protein
MIQEKPDKVFETILKKRFAKQDLQLLGEAWKVAQQAHARDIRVNAAQLENSQKVSLVAKLLDPRTRSRATMASSPTSSSTERSKLRSRWAMSHGALWRPRTSCYTVENLSTRHPGQGMPWATLALA